MSNISGSSGSDIAVAKNQEAKALSTELCKMVSELTGEMHQALQLPAKDLAKIDHIEWKLDWKPELTVRMYPRKS